MSPLAKRIVLKWRTDTSSKMAEDYKWYCPVCDKVYEKQTDAQLCCMAKKTQPHWFKEDMAPGEPVGVRHEMKFIPFVPGKWGIDPTTGVPDRYITGTGDIVVFTGDKYDTHFIIPKKEQRDYVSSTASLFCYIDQAFEEWWETEKHEYRMEERAHNVRWNSLIQWIDRYLELKPIPSHQIRCIIETRQEYEDFTIEDLLHTLKTLGEEANHMYCAERDHFPGPLKKYHDRAMNHLVWNVATLSQGYQNFMDLVTRLTELCGVMPSASVTARHVDQTEKVEAIQKIVDNPIVGYSDRKIELIKEVLTRL